MKKVQDNACHTKLEEMEELRELMANHESAIRRLKTHSVQLLTQGTYTLEEINKMLYDLTFSKNIVRQRYNIAYAEIYGCVTPISRLKSDIENILNLNKD